MIAIALIRELYYVVVDRSNARPVCFAIFQLLVQLLLYLQISLFEFFSSVSVSFSSHSSCSLTDFVRGIGGNQWMATVDACQKLKKKKIRAGP